MKVRIIYQRPRGGDLQEAECLHKSETELELGTVPEGHRAKFVKTSRGKWYRYVPQIGGEPSFGIRIEEIH